ncbi:MAG: universal stress protein, partial [Polyangiaceae bacterium]|nr:universal stress protein [Polyangiaceae bacterium]
RALRTAVQLARLNGATLTALHVVGMPPSLSQSDIARSFRSDSKIYRDLLRRQTLAAEAQLSREIGTAVGVQRDVHVRMLIKVGAVANAIAAVVQELDADLVIVARGARGKLGSTAERVVRLVGRSVLVVPAGPARTLRLVGKAPPPSRKSPKRPRAVA